MRKCVKYDIENIIIENNFNNICERPFANLSCRSSSLIMRLLSIWTPVNRTKFGNESSAMLKIIFFIEKNFNNIERPFAKVCGCSSSLIMRYLSKWTSVKK